VIFGHEGLKLAAVHYLHGTITGVRVKRESRVQPFQGEVPHYPEILSALIDLGDLIHTDTHSHLDGLAN
jgi:hypothetical protein